MSDNDDRDEELRQLEIERAQVIKQYRIASASTIAVLLIGALFFHETEHWSWLNSFYFCTTTLTTVGYGDLTPKTDAGKLFDIFYVLIGIGILAYFANIMLKNILVRRQYRRAKKHPIQRKL
jgi:hypothetical protein